MKNASVPSGALRLDETEATRRGSTPVRGKRALSRRGFRLVGPVTGASARRYFRRLCRPFPPRTDGCISPGGAVWSASTRAASAARRSLSGTPVCRILLPVNVCKRYQAAAFGCYCHYITIRRKNPPLFSIHPPLVKYCRYDQTYWNPEITVSTTDTQMSACPTRGSTSNSQPGTAVPARSVCSQLQNSSAASM